MNKKIYSVLLLNFVNQIGFSIIFPVLPFIIKDFDASPFVYGILLALYPLFQFIAAPILGSLSDSIGRKKILLISHAGTMFAWVVFGLSYFAPNVQVGGIALPLIVIGIARIIDGATGGNSAVANAYMADVTTPEERSKVFGLLGAIMGLSIIIGPSLGALSATTSIGYLGTAITAFFISFVTIIWMFFYLDETIERKHTLNTQEIKEKLNFFNKFNILHSEKHLQGLFTSRTFMGFVFACYGSVIGLFIIDRFQFSQQTFGLFTMFVGTFLIFNQWFMVKQFVKKIGDYRTLMLGQIFTIAGFVFITFPKEISTYVIFYYILNLGVSLSMPTFKSLISKGVDASRQGEVMGLDEALMSATGIFGPLVAGYLFSTISYNIFYILSALSIVAVGILTLNNQKHLFEKEI